MELQKKGGIRQWALAFATLVAMPAAAQVLRYEVVHDHAVKSCSGVLAIDEHGVSFEGGSKHSWNWPYTEIQQLTLEPERIRVLTYKDNLWKLGADREYEFRAVAGKPFAEAYGFLESRMDQRLVSRLGDAEVAALWRIPAKLQGRFRGSEGTLIVGEDRIVYSTGREGESRAWRYEDIDNISTSGPFQLTITTFERSRMSYGSRKGFNFQLKERLEEARYNELWRRLNRCKGIIQ